MFRIILFLLFVILIMTVVLLFKIFFDKSASKDKPPEPEDDLDKVVKSWEASDREN